MYNNKPVKVNRGQNEKKIFIEKNKIKCQLFERFSKVRGLQLTRIRTFRPSRDIRVQTGRRSSTRIHTSARGGPGKRENLKQLSQTFKKIIFIVETVE